MTKLQCKLFGHIWVNIYSWHDKLKVNIPITTCVRCGSEDSASNRKIVKEFEADACPECGAWVCTSGICVYCGALS